MFKDIDSFLQSLTLLKEKNIESLNRFFSTYCYLIKTLDHYFNDNQEVLENYRKVIVDSNIKWNEVLSKEQLILLHIWANLPYSDEYKGEKRNLKYKIISTFYERMKYKNYNFEYEDIKYNCNICNEQHFEKERHLITCED